MQLELAGGGRLAWLGIGTSKGAMTAAAGAWPVVGYHLRSFDGAFALW